MKRLSYKCDYCGAPETNKNRLHGLRERSVLLCQQCFSRELERA
jgi:hypothetical protein